jgi:acetyl-CoA carboxylase biotin carboxyl carrier protein
LIEIRAPMVAKVVDILVEPGAAVNADDELLILESMKMEIPVLAPEGGTVQEVRIAAGDSVQEDEVLLVLQS